MAKTKAWFEGELRRMLGFDEVEEIARFALDSFPVSQPLELRQYLEQFLGQSKEVENLCNELSARRKGASPATAAASRPEKPRPSATSDDFWGGGAAAGRGMTGASGRSGATGGTGGVTTGPNRRGQPGGNPPPQAAAGGGGGSNARGKGKGKGKVYQKAAAEADFWGGGTTSGRSKPASPPSAAKPGGPGGGATATTSVSGSDRVSHPATAAAPPAPSPSPAPGAVPSGARQAAGGTGAPPKGSAGGFNKGGAVIAPAAATTSKTGGGRRAKGGGKTPRPASDDDGGGASAGAAAGIEAAAAAAAAAAVAAAPQWSGVTCLCMGKTHDVVINCTSCGKIACVKEGGFGCSFCGSALPSTGREPRRSTSGGGDSGGAVQAGGAEPQSAALKEALERKDRLLLFDRTSASRTRVLDDQGDYFTSHNWLSQGEREKGEAEEKARRDEAASRRGARRQVKMSIDIMGRRVIETQAPQESEEGGGGGDGVAASSGGAGADDDASKAHGISLDFGSTSTGGGGGSGGGKNNAGDEGGAPRAEQAEGQTQRVSLENTGLRGRAKEVYDVMRANLDKKSRRRPGGGGGAAAGGVRKAGIVAEKSRVSLWRVQHDVDSDILLRQDQPGVAGDGGGGGGGGGPSDGFQRFEPADELACAR